MKFAAIAIALVLVGCTPSSKDVSRNYAPPEELKDCSFHRLGNDNGGYITVVRCPNSSTTTKTSGKNARTTVVIDGVEYKVN